MASRLDTRVLLVLVTALTTLALTSSGNVQGAWAVSYADLLSHREAKLFYPGSRLIQSGGRGEYAERCHSVSLMCTPGDVPAFVQNQFVVEGVLPSQIFGWYQDALSGAGWRQGPSGDAIHIQAYVRAPGEEFDLNVHNVDESRELLGSQRQLVLYFTGYRLGTCPSISAGCHSDLVAAAANDPGPAEAAPTGWIYLDDITNRPEAHLYFPGSSVVGSNGYGEGAGHLFGFSDPWVSTSLISVGTGAQIEAWYQTELAARRYRRVATSFPGVAEEFRRGAEIFQLILPDTDYGRGPYGVAGLMYAVSYEIDTCEGHHPPSCRG